MPREYIKLKGDQKREVIDKEELRRAYMQFRKV